MHVFFWYVAFFFVFFRHLIQPRQDKRSSGLFFHQIPPFCIHYHHIAQTSNKRSSGYLPTWSFPPTHRTHSAQTSYKHSSGLIFSFKPFTSASITFPSSPDECLSLIWAIFSPDSSLSFPQPSHPAQMSASRSFGLFFFSPFTGPLIPVSLTISCDPDELQALVWLHFQHGLFSSTVSPLSQPHPAQTSIKQFFSHLPFTS